MTTNRIILIVVLLAGIAALTLIDRWYRTELDLLNQHRISEAAVTIEHDFTHSIQRLIESVASLQAFMLAGEHLPDEQSFLRFSSTLKQRHPDLTALVYVGADRHIRRIYPLERHEQAVGLDLSERPSAAYVEKAVATRRIVVDDPHLLSSGELAIVIRAPLYRGDDFQGLAQGVVDIPSLAARLEPWSDDYEFNITDQNGNLFWGPEALSGDVQRRILAIGDTTWTLRVARNLSLSRAEFFVFVLIWVGGGSMLLLGLFQVHRWGNQRELLHHAVESKTRALAESEQKYRALMENASDAIVVVGAEGLFIDANHRAEMLLGYTAEEFRAIGPPDIHPASEKERLEEAFRQMAQEGSSRFEHLIITKAGRLFPVEVVGTRIDIGDDTYYLGHFRDISERRRIERELERHRNELEELVEERTRELQATNQELEAFSYSVSHDLRAPLRAINGFGEALREDYSDVLDDLAHTYLDRMHKATLRMSDLIDGLLNLSRVFRAELKLGVIDLSELARDSVSMLRESEPEREIKVSIAPGMEACADGTLMRLLLQNLIGNAWKFTRNEKRPVIEVGVERSGGREVFFVRDNGAGFEMQYAHKLFQPFERLHAETEYSGTGIGLATVRRIVQRHGGEVWAEGRPDQGATIYFTIPARASEAVAKTA